MVGHRAPGVAAEDRIRVIFPGSIMVKLLSEASSGGADQSL